MSEQGIYDLDGWRPVNCAESERVRAEDDLVVLTSLTDPAGAYGPPVVYTEWGSHDGEPLLREYLRADDEGKQCSHYVPDTEQQS